MTVHRVGVADDIPAMVRAATGASLVLIVEPGRDALSAALAEAAIGPLAVECAPAMRLNAVIAGQDGPAVEAMAAFLDAATSTTGQVVRAG